MIEVNSLVKPFDGFRALDNASVTVPQGAIYGLVGPNGAGKTTLLRHLTGVYRQDRGTIAFDGTGVWENPAVKTRIASIPDDWHYFMQSTVREMMKLYRGFYPQFNMERYEKLKGVFEIDETHMIRRLSKGMQQKVQFIASVAHSPQLLILDEPFSGFDADNADMLRREILRLKASGTAILLSTHNLQAASDLCDNTLQL